MNRALIAHTPLRSALAQCPVGGERVERGRTRPALPRGSAGPDTIARHDRDNALFLSKNATCYLTSQC